MSLSLSNHSMADEDLRYTDMDFYGRCELAALAPKKPRKAPVISENLFTAIVGNLRFIFVKRSLTAQTILAISVQGGFWA